MLKLGIGGRFLKADLVFVLDKDLIIEIQRRQIEGLLSQIQEPRARVLELENNQKKIAALLAGAIRRAIGTACPAGDAWVIILTTPSVMPNWFRHPTDIHACLVCGLTSSRHS